MFFNCKAGMFLYFYILFSNLKCWRSSALQIKNDLYQKLLKFKILFYCLKSHLKMWIYIHLPIYLLLLLLWSKLQANYFWLIFFYFYLHQTAKWILIVQCFFKNFDETKIIKTFLVICHQNDIFALFFIYFSSSFYFTAFF